MPLDSVLYAASGDPYDSSVYPVYGTLVNGRIAIAMSGLRADKTSSHTVAIAAGLGTYTSTAWAPGSDVTILGLYSALASGTAITTVSSLVAGSDVLAYWENIVLASGAYLLMNYATNLNFYVKKGTSVQVSCVKSSGGSVNTLYNTILYTEE